MIREPASRSKKSSARLSLATHNMLWLGRSCSIFILKLNGTSMPLCVTSITRSRIGRLGLHLGTVRGNVHHRHNPGSTGNTWQLACVKRSLGTIYHLFFPPYNASLLYFETSHLTQRRPGSSSIC